MVDIIYTSEYNNSERIDINYLSDNGKCFAALNADSNEAKGGIYMLPFEV